ncbi:MAG: PadR family transcriptional regulator [Candidatus Altiarchaeota archaeon]
MPLKRLKEKTTRENLWLYILSLLNKGPLYAYEIRDKIQREFGFTIGNMTAYMVLYKLNMGGYVKDEWVHQTGRPRRYYTITAKGKKQFDEGITYLKELPAKLLGK